MFPKLRAKAERFGQRWFGPAVVPCQYPIGPLSQFQALAIRAEAIEMAMLGTASPQSGHKLWLCKQAQWRSIQGDRAAAERFRSPDADNLCISKIDYIHSDTVGLLICTV
jgi:hypothetical protein